MVLVLPVGSVNQVIYVIGTTERTETTISEGLNFKVSVGEVTAATVSEVGLLVSVDEPKIVYEVDAPFMVVRAAESTSEDCVLLEEA